jgi:hypothetical protein
MGATLEQLKKLKELEALQKKQLELKSKNNLEAVDLLTRMLHKLKYDEPKVNLYE